MTSFWSALHALNDFALFTKVQAQIYYPWASAATLAVFTAVSSIRIFAYIPQILQAAADRNGASAISYTTWGLFFVSNMATAAYALVCLGDGIMALVFLGNAAACLAIVAVTFVKRLRHRRHLQVRAAMHAVSGERATSVPWT
jgi:hypothetical protein